MTAFTLTIGQTYYQKGFFNVPADAGRYLGRHGDPVTLILDDAGQIIKTQINRNATPNGAPRLNPKAKLRDWFQANFMMGDTVEVEILSPQSIRIGAANRRSNETTAPETLLDRAYAALYLRPSAPLPVAEAAYKVAMKKAHPDAGGTDQAARELIWAIETVRQYATA